MIFKFLSWPFGHVEKTASLERSGLFQNLWLHNPVINNYNAHIAQNLMK